MFDVSPETTTHASSPLLWRGRERLKLADDGWREEEYSRRLLFFVSLCVFVTWWFKKQICEHPFHP